MHGPNHYSPGRGSQECSIRNVDSPGHYVDLLVDDTNAPAGSQVRRAKHCRAMRSPKGWGPITTCTFPSVLTLDEIVAYAPQRLIIIEYKHAGVSRSRATRQALAILRSVNETVTSQATSTN